MSSAGRRGQRAFTRDREYKARMELAVKGFNDGTYKTVNAAAKAHEVSEFCSTDPPLCVNFIEPSRAGFPLVSTATVFHFDKSPPCADFAEP
jgi:hypothetical protein